MATITRQIPSDEWQHFFDRMTHDLLTDDTPRAATIEVLSPTLGDQVAARLLRLHELSYDPRRQLLTVLLDDLDHECSPTEIWILQEDNGSVTALQVRCADGTQEIIYLWRSGPLARRYDVLVELPKQ